MAPATRASSPGPAASGGIAMALMHRAKVSSATGPT